MAYTEQQLKDAANKALDAGDTAAAKRLVEQAKAARAADIKARTEKLGPISRAAIGAITPVMEVGTGIGQGIQKGARAIGVPESWMRQGLQETIEDVRAARSGAGTAGTVGEIATFALPGGAATKVAGRLLPRAGMAARAAAVGAGEGAGYELARPEVEGTSRLDRAAGAAALGAAGGAAAPAVGRVLGGALGAPSKAVQETLKRAQDVGVRLPLTLGQMLGGRSDAAARGVRVLEEGLSAIPLSPIRGGRENALEAWNKAELRQVGQAGGLRPGAVTKPGNEGLQRLQTRRDALYRAALGNTPLPARAVPLARAGALVSRQVPSVAEDVTIMLRNISDDFGSGKMTAERAKNMLSQARVKASNAYKAGDFEAGSAYEAIQKDLMDALTKAIGPQRAALLKRADAMHAQMVPIEESAKMAGARRRDTPGIFSPQQVGGNLLRRSPRSTAASGRMAGQAENEAAQATFGNTIPPVGPGTAEKMSAGTFSSGLGAALGGAAGSGMGGAAVGALAAPYGIAALLRSPPVARALTGMTKAQQSQYMQQLLAALRSNTAAGLGMGTGQAISE